MFSKIRYILTIPIFILNRIELELECWKQKKERKYEEKAYDEYLNKREQL